METRSPPLTDVLVEVTKIRRIPEHTNKELLAYAERSQPPQEWYDKAENVFEPPKER